MVNKLQPSTTPGYFHKYISTTNLALDVALCGGVPENHICEFYGPEGSGKTTAAYKVIGSALRKYPNSRAILVDIEDSFEPMWAEQLGVDISRLDQPSKDPNSNGFLSHERMYEDALSALQDPDVHYSVLVIDSIASTATDKEIADPFSQDRVAEQAKFLHKMFKKLNSIVAVARSKNKPLAIICINQVRMKVNLMGLPPSRTSPGGSALKFYSNFRIFFKTNSKSKYTVESALKEFKQFWDPEFLRGKNDQFLYDECEFILDKGRGGAIHSGTIVLTKQECPKLGLGYLEYINLPFLESFTKSFGVRKGGGSSYYLSFEPETKFKNLDEMHDHLLANPEYYNKACIEVLAASRAVTKKHRLPPDNYLFGFFIEEDETNTD